MLPMSKNIDFLKSVPAVKNKSFLKRVNRKINNSKMAKTREGKQEKHSISFFVRHSGIDIG